MKNILTILLFCVFFCAPTYAQEQSALNLLESCSIAKKVMSGNGHAVVDEEQMTRGVGCIAYFKGYLDGIVSAQVGGFCLPNNVSPAQVLLIFEKYANDNLNNLHLSPHTVLSEALAINFPCPKLK